MDEIALLIPVAAYTGLPMRLLVGTYPGRTNEAASCGADGGLAVVTGDMTDESGGVSFFCII